MRRPLIAGNWKMNKTSAEARALVAELAAAPRRSDVDVLVCPPFTALAAASEAAAGSPIALGAQDFFWKDSGAYTGHISPPMLRELGCHSVLVGHSERRGRFGALPDDFTPEVLALFGDNDRTVNLKVRAAHAHGLTPIVCCGELLPERRDGLTDEVVRAQVQAGLGGLSAAEAAATVVAYEPVWAIGTGETCAAEEADRVCDVIRETVGRAFGGAAEASVRILYGGSVKPGKAADLLGREQIDGALVGGASLVAADFLAIIAAAPA